MGLERRDLFGGKGGNDQDSALGEGVGAAICITARSIEGNLEIYETFYGSIRGIERILSLFSDLTRNQMNWKFSFNMRNATKEAPVATVWTEPDDVDSH